MFFFGHIRGQNTKFKTVYLNISIFDEINFFATELEVGSNTRIKDIIQGRVKKGRERLIQR